LHDHKKFDAFRGIAALTVALSHIVQIYIVRLIGWEHPAWIIARTLGQHAVLVFFLLSGYLITLSILRNRESLDGFSAREFITARIARIYPPFLASLGLIAICWIVLHTMHLPGVHSRFGVATDGYAVGPMTFQPWEVVTSLAMIRGMTLANPPFWSLYFEVWAYVIAFFLALGIFGRHRNLRGVSLATAVVAIGATLIRVPNFVFFFGIWSLGAAICLLTHYRNQYLDVCLTSLAIIGTLVIAALALINPLTLASGYPVHAIEHSAAAAFAGIYSYLIFTFRPLNRRYPKWLVNTGSFSYTLYVVHFPILAVGLAATLPWVGTSLPRSILCGTMVFAFDVAFARTLARYVERPAYFKRILLQAWVPFLGIAPPDRE